MEMEKESNLCIRQIFGGDEGQKIKRKTNIFSIKHDLARSCFQLWPKIGDEGDKISRKKNWRGAS